MENVFFARQPILDVNNNTYGYELLYRNQPGVNAYTGNNGDVSTADVINNAFFVDNITSVLGGKKAFVNFTGNLIKRGVPKMISSDILVFEDFLEVSGKAEIGGKRYTIKCSVGIAWSESCDVDYAQYFDEADEQLYRAKKEGKHRICRKKIV